MGLNGHDTFGATDMSPWMRPPWSTLTLHFKPKNHLASLAASASPCAKLQFSENHDFLKITLALGMGMLHRNRNAKRMSLLGKSGSMHFWTAPKVVMKNLIDLIVPMHTNPRWLSHEIHRLQRVHICGGF